MSTSRAQGKDKGNKPQSRPSLLKALSNSYSFFQTKASKKKKDLDALHSEYIKLLRAVKNAENEELAWRFLYYKVSGDAEGSGLRSWVSGKKKDEARIQEAMGVLGRTHGDLYGKRRIKDRAGDGDQVATNHDVFNSAFEVYKNQQFHPQLRVEYEDQYSLQVGIMHSEEDCKVCREELQKFEASEGFIYLRAHERAMTLAAYKQLLANVEGQVQVAKKATEGFYSFERDLVRLKRTDFLKRERQPFRALEDHLKGSERKSKGGRKLSKDELENRCEELRKNITQLELLITSSGAGVASAGNAD